MRYATIAIILAAMSIGEAVAKPTHVHRHRHEKKAAEVDWKSLDWNSMNIDWAKAYKEGMAAKAEENKKKQDAPAATPSVPAATPSVPAATPSVPAATPSLPAAPPSLPAAPPSVPAAPQAVPAAPPAVPAAPPSVPAATPSVPVATPLASQQPSQDNRLSDHGSSVGKSGVAGLANDLKTFGGRVKSIGAEIDATGNIGSPQGSNMIKVPSASGYDFTANFINTSGRSMTVVVWNKAFINPTTKKIDANLGACVAPESPILTFELAIGASQVVAFDSGSLVGWAESTPDRTPAGAFATTWGEASFKAGASGYDMSAIQNPHGNNYDMCISSMEAPHCTSDHTQNFWLTDTQPIGDSDGSCYIPQKTATLTVKMGGTL